MYLHIKKAFDRVPHKRLLWKIKYIRGIKGNILNWMTDYLTDWKMRTMIRDTPLSWSTITSGVIKGSVLSTIIFQVYINNNIQEGLSSYINLVADDAKLLRVIKNIGDYMELQKNIDKTREWSQKWK
ncbi:hypothetical protein E2C01_053581 [Portunus trituberculatus]|uniref:Reverse transcriptase domain-containing protein n=1 Tax=Portunus trituberculatus TaxID=210409 RepID=A0A5B7GQP5_PORTR|nr:hypothetical protein [Portunus trituberculatus]